MARLRISINRTRRPPGAADPARREKAPAFAGAFFVPSPRGIIQVMRQKQTAPQAVQAVLGRLENGAGQADYSDLLNVPELPLDLLAEVGTLTWMENPGGLPSLLIETPTGQAQIEVSPFGSLALISGDGGMNTDPVAQALGEAGITPLFPGDLDAAGEWHGNPMGRWLFPRRLSDALALFDAL